MNALARIEEVRYVREQQAKDGATTDELATP